MKYRIGPYSAIALVSAFLVLPMPHNAQAQSQIEKRLQFLKDQTSCSADIIQLCSGVKLGSGRLYKCLYRNKARLTEQCIRVLPEAGRLLRRAGILETKVAAAEKPTPGYNTRFHRPC